MAAKTKAKPTRTQRMGAQAGNLADKLALYRVAVALNNKRLICIRYVAAQRAGVQMADEDTVARNLAWNSLNERGRDRVRAALDGISTLGMALRAKDGPAATKR